MLNVNHLRNTQSGVSLLEVLISLVVLTVGLLGMAALQTSALQNNQSSFLRTQAVIMSYYAMDAMRVDYDNAVDGDYDLNKTCQVPAASTSLASKFHHDWIQSLQDNLGAGACGAINCASADCVVQVWWAEGRATGGQAEQELQTGAKL